MTLKTLKDKVSGPRSGEDRGVSPVIGIVLMVAITVVLAAVIGAFVLGMGDGIGDSAAPNAQLSISEGDEGVDLEHNGGDSIDLSEFTVLVGNEVHDDSLDERELSAGETVSLGSAFGDIEIRHDPSGSIVASGTVDGDGGGG